MIGPTRFRGFRKAIDCSVFEVPVFQQTRWHLLGLKDIIDEAAGRSALRHAKLGAMIERGFAQSQATTFLDRLNPDRSVASKPRQDDPDCVFTLILRQ